MHGTSLKSIDIRDAGRPANAGRRAARALLPSTPFSAAAVGTQTTPSESSSTNRAGNEHPSDMRERPTLLFSTPLRTVIAARATTSVHVPSAASRMHDDPPPARVDALVPLPPAPVTGAAVGAQVTASVSSPTIRPRDEGHSSSLLSPVLSPSSVSPAGGNSQTPLGGFRILKDAGGQILQSGYAAQAKKKHKIRDHDAFVWWFESKGDGKLVRPTAPGEGNLGDLYVHQWAGGVQCWMWDLGVGWIRAEVGHAHPTLAQHRLHILDNAEPRWVTRKTHTTYGSRKSGLVTPTTG